ncbi:MAG: NAD(P)/FAD-dependent oxidoreductase [Ruthenibacterium lactatiformans]
MRIPLKKINRALKKRFGGRVQAVVERSVLVLRGSAEDWDGVVAVGRLAASPKSRWYTVNEVTWPGAAQRQPKPVPQTDESLAGRAPDVLLIGAGVTGAAIARELMRRNVDLLWVEKEHDVALHASSRNDGMVHPGVDLHKGTAKYHYNRLGNRMYGGVCAALGVLPAHGTVPVLRAEQCAPSYFTLPYWKWLGLSGVRVLGDKALHAAEPGVDEALHCGLFFPQAGIVCPYGLTIAMAENAVQNGAHLSLDTCVTGMDVENGRILAVHTNRGTVRPRIVINAAGVFCEDIAQMAQDHFFSIHPRKGTNAILDKKAKRMVRTIYSGMGTTATKTVHSKGGGIVSTVDGNVLVGPDAVETPEKEDFSTSVQSVRATFEKQRHAAPALRESDIITYFTGVRAATYEEDFIIRPGMFTENIIPCGGHPVSGADGCARHRAGGGAAGLWTAFRDNPARAMPPTTRHAGPYRMWRGCGRGEGRAHPPKPDYGEIVCRCEEVSRGEILDALRRPVPCDTVDGVKRRVRPGMGRCQGGFCGPLVTAIIAEEKGISLEQVRKSGAGSAQLLHPTKQREQKTGTEGGTEDGAL